MESPEHPWKPEAGSRDSALSAGPGVGTLAQPQAETRKEAKDRCLVLAETQGVLWIGQVALGMDTWKLGS